MIRLFLTSIGFVAGLGAISQAAVLSPDPASSALITGNDDASNSDIIAFVTGLGFTDLTAVVRFGDPCQGGPGGPCTSPILLADEFSVNLGGWDNDSFVVTGDPYVDNGGGEGEANNGTIELTLQGDEVFPTSPNSGLFFVSYKSGGGTAIAYYEGGIMDGDTINFDLPALIGTGNALSHFTVFSATAPEADVPLPMSLLFLLAGIGGLAWTARPASTMPPGESGP